MWLSSIWKGFSTGLDKATVVKTVVRSDYSVAADMMAEAEAGKDVPRCGPLLLCMGQHRAASALHCHELMRGLAYRFEAPAHFVAHFNSRAGRGRRADSVIMIRY